MIDELLSRLDKVKPSGKNQWKAICPCHNEKTPSLQIKDTQDKILAHCFGCGATGIEVAEAVGLKASDMFYTELSDDERRTRKAKHTEKELYHEKLILELAQGDREAGKKLSRRDLEREALAYRRVRDAASQ